MCIASPHYREGVPFVAVHDSYWTHACFIDEMNRVRTPGMLLTIVCNLKALTDEL